MSLQQVTAWRATARAANVRVHVIEERYSQGYLAVGPLTKHTTADVQTQQVKCYWQHDITSHACL